jgi:hypothetical protein
MMLWFSSLEVSIFVFIFFATNSYFAPSYNHSEVIGSFHYFLSHSEDFWLMKSNLPWKCKTTSVIWYLTQTKWKRFSPIYMPFKSVFERNPLCILHKRHRLENWERSNGLFDWLNSLFR